MVRIPRPSLIPYGVVRPELPEPCSAVLGPEIREGTVEAHGLGVLQAQAKVGQTSLFHRRPRKSAIAHRVVWAHVPMNDRNPEGFRIRNGSSCPISVIQGSRPDCVRGPQSNTRWAPFNNAKSRSAGYERHVVGDDRLGETLQGERANLFGRHTFEPRIDALAGRRICPSLASAQRRAATLHTVPIAYSRSARRSRSGPRSHNPGRCRRQSPIRDPARATRRSATTQPRASRRPS